MIDNAKRGNPFLKIALYAAAFNIILTPLTSIVAVFFGYIAIIAFILYPFTVKSVWLNFPIAVALIPIICILSCIQSASFFDINSIESYLLSLICLISFYLSISKENKNDMLTFNDMVNVSYMLSIAFIVYTFGGFDFSYQDLGSYGIKSFTMGLGNPNGVSLYVLFVIMVFLLKFSISKTKSKKVFYVILMLVMSYILIKLSSRTVILCAILAMLVLIFHKSKRFVKILVICACLISVLIIPFLIYQSNGMSEISILGKVLNTGRDVIYKDFLNSLDLFRIIFGQFFRYPLTNLHNGQLSIFASMGILGTVCCISVWFYFIRRLLHIENAYRRIAFAFTMLFILHSAMEAMSVIGTVPYSIFVLTIVKIADGEILLHDEVKGEI